MGHESHAPQQQPNAQHTTDGTHHTHQPHRDSCYDPATSALRPNCFADTAEYIVLRAIPAALALVRDGQGWVSVAAAATAVLDQPVASAIAGVAEMTPVLKEALAAHCDALYP